jgi:outer membrane lipoprotein SlyB
MSRTLSTTTLALALLFGGTAQAEPASIPSKSQLSNLCKDCAWVSSVRSEERKGEASGLGVIGGAVVGGLLGNQVGDGDGKKIATVVGAVGGAVAGNEIEKRVKKTVSYEIVVRLDDGTTRAFTEENAPAWRSGDKVRIVNGRIQSNA